MAELFIEVEVWFGDFLGRMASRGYGECFEDLLLNTWTK